MRNEYDITKLNPRRNPYASKVKKPITISVKEGTIMYFKDLAEETGIPYQTIINFYLDECAKEKRRLEFV